MARKANGEEKTVVLESLAGTTPDGLSELWHITEKRPFRMGGRGSFARRPVADRVQIERPADDGDPAVTTVDVGPTEPTEPAEPDGGFARLLAGSYVPRFDVMVGR